jgi:hypothetical protein
MYIIKKIEMFFKNNQKKMRFIENNETVVLAVATLQFAVRRDLIDKESLFIIATLLVMCVFT